ncbi:MAG: hypothetical protein MJ124_02500 [Lachnospiraceae bacterium]|nr:hypothetical protein [Lachnospiraceae bacterium]
MGEISVFMAIVDFIPVVLFFIAAVILQRDLYSRLVKGAYSLLASGSIMVLTGGFFKALWKILYALNVCDYVQLNQSFFVIQAPGYIFFFLGLLGLFYKPEKKGVKTYAVAPVVFTSTLPFIVLQVLGLGGAQIVLMISGFKKKNYFAPVCFVVSFICMLGMGYLGAKFDSSSKMHWLAQVTNTISMTAFLMGTVSLHKKGFEREEIR